MPPSTQSPGDAASRGDPRSDRELVDLARGGDTGAFEILYRRHRDWVMRLAFRWTGDREDALDVLQETFSYLLRKLPALRLEARMTTFLYPVVRNLSTRVREKRRFVPLPEGMEVADPRTAGEPHDLERRQLAAAVDALPEPQREVLLLRFVDDLSLGEIAELLRIPTGTVKSRLHYALRALREDPRSRERFRG